MKKLLYLAVAAVACAGALSLSSCGGSSKDTAGKEQVDSVVMPESKVFDLTDVDFKAKVADYTTASMDYVGDEPCIVDFWATWCGPCMALSPALHEISDTTGIIVYKVNVDNAPAVAEAYGIQTIPALFLCKDGKMTPYEGSRAKADLLATAQDLLK